MEGMPAHRQQPEPVLPIKFTQAHRTVERLFAATDNFTVREHRQRIDERLVEPRVVQMEQLLQLPVHCRVPRACPVRRRRRLPHGGTTAVLLLHQYPHKEVEQPGDEEDNRKDHYDEQHRRADLPIAAATTDTSRLHLRRGLGAVRRGVPDEAAEAGRRRVR